MANRAALLLWIGAAAYSSTAVAHGEADWLHRMLDGAVTFFTALEYLLPVFVVALLARHHGLRPVIIQGVSLAVGILLGGFAYNLMGDSAAVGLYARGYLIALGILVLLNLRLHAWLRLILTAAAGLLIGLEAWNADATDPAAALASAVGFLSSATFFFLCAALIASRYTGGWQRIAIRVAASWIAAIAAIDIAFMIVRSG